MFQKKKLIDIILKDKTFQFTTINSYNVEKYKNLVHELLLGCKYPYYIEYELMKFANSISSINCNNKSSCPIQKCLNEIDNIHRLKRTFFCDEDKKQSNEFLFIKKKEFKVRNQLCKLKAKLKYINYRTKANYINILKELNTNDIDFSALRNNYDYILLKADFKLHNCILQDIHVKMCDNSIYNRHNIDIQHVCNKNNIWKVWINQN
jgi:hypothetical protein